MAKSLETIEIVGKAGRLRVNKSDLGLWLKKGYKIQGEKEPKPVELSVKPEPEPEPKSESEIDVPTEKAIRRMSRVKLVEVIDQFELPINDDDFDTIAELREAVWQEI